ncbi:MAG: hypothetical protein EA356_12045 [Geminicoccaceae bacterium]|nr:MAG: hypothetical protein EA356_12045 [Geminicoccaceae bacterium]
MTALCWWRDDDAGRDHPRLHRLLDLAEAHGLPIALAVVPAWLEPLAVQRIRACPLATVLQHGIGHDDHSDDDQRKIELGGTVDRAWLAGELVAQRQRLEDAFGAQFLPVMVPPWNRMDPGLVPRLAELGFLGVSMDRGPVVAGPPRRVDAHVDAMDWQGTGRQKPLAAILGELDAGLAAGVRPLGLMTHHLVVDEAGFADLDQLFRLGHDAASFRWAAARELFVEREPAAA